MGFTPPLAKTVHPDHPVWGNVAMRERSLLGALLHDSTTVPQVLGIVRAEDFTTGLHERLFQALARRRQSPADVDLPSVASALGDYALDAEGGCEASLARLVEERAAPGDIGPFAVEIAAAAQMRRSRPETIDEDVAAWSHRQAELLTRLATRTDEISLSVDWGSLIEEVLHVGRSQTRGVQKKIVRIFEHLLKALSDPDAPSRLRWRIEIDAWTERLKREATPSMRQLIDLDAAWRQGRADAEADFAEYGVRLPRDIPMSCPFSFDDLVCGTTTAVLLARLVLETSTSSRNISREKP